MANLVLGAGPREVYKGANLWFDNGRLIEQNGTVVQIVDPKSKKTVYKADLGVKKLARKLFRVFGDHVVFTTNQGGNRFHVNAYSLRERRLLWRFDSGVIVSPEPAALVGDSLYVISQSSVFKLTTGGKRLARKDAPYPHSLAATSKYVYFCSQHELYRLDSATLTRGWRSYCDPTGFYLSAHGAIVYSGMGHAIKRIGADGKIVWTSRAATGLVDYVDADLRFALPDKFLVTGSRWFSDRTGATMLSQYLYLFSAKGRILWKKPMNLRAAVIVGRHVAVLRYQENDRRSGSVTLEIRRLSDGRLEWESRPAKFYGLESGGEYFLTRGKDGFVVYQYSGK